ncbi:hypothetical protein ACFL02_01290 [Planctomycetota bacterium]
MTDLRINFKKSGKQEYFYTLRNLGFHNYLKLFSNYMFSSNNYYILKRKLSYMPSKVPKDIAPDAMVLLGDNDMETLKKQARLLEPDDRRELLSRILFYQSGFKNCYIIKIKNEIAYLQWLIYPSENRIIKQSYRRKFYLLGDKQVMIENAFTFPKYRRLGFLPFGTSQLVNKAAAQGYKSAICYVREERIIMLNEFSRMGFKITKMMKEYKMTGYVWRNL